MDKCSAYDTSKGALPRDLIERPALLGHLSKERVGHREQKTKTIITDLILDCFGGSGTTFVCAIENNRDCITIEMDNDNYEMITNRVSNELKDYKLDNLT